jgi:hypothetical protein
MDFIVAVMVAGTQSESGNASSLSASALTA